MAVRTATIKEGSGPSGSGHRNYLQVVWTGLLNGDSGSPVEVGDFSDCTVQVGGTFGAGGSITFEGSNNEGGAGTYLAFTDPQGNAVTKTVAASEALAENPRYRRPRVTAGDGSTSLTVTMWCRRPR